MTQTVKRNLIFGETPLRDPNEHRFRTEGSDCTPYRMVGMCSCGWSSPVIAGQGPRSQQLARQMWVDHMMEVANND